MIPQKASAFLALAILAVAPGCGARSSPPSSQGPTSLAPTPEIQAAMELASAKAFENSRKKKQALEAYRRIVKVYPESPQAKVAGERAKALGGR